MLRHAVHIVVDMLRHAVHIVVDMLRHAVHIVVDMLRHAVHSKHYANKLCLLNNFNCPNPTVEHEKTERYQCQHGEERPNPMYSMIV